MQRPIELRAPVGSSCRVIFKFPDTFCPRIRLFHYSLQPGLYPNPSTVNLYRERMLSGFRDRPLRRFISTDQRLLRRIS